jgi:hypothetical protein
MSIIIFFSASKQIFFCRNDVQAIDFLRKGSYAPDIIKDHQTNVLCILHVGKNVRVKLEKNHYFLQFRYFVVLYLNF